MSRATLQADCTPLQEALYRTVHEYRRGNQGGAAVLGPMLGKSAAVLSNEVNPAVTTHKHGFADSVTLQLLTHDYRILYAYCQALNHLAIPLPEPDSVSDVELLNQFSLWQGRLGSTCQEIHNALEDHRITPDEAARVRRRFFEHMRAGMSFLERLDQLVEGER